MCHKMQPILSFSPSDPAPPSRRLFWQLNALVFVILGGYGITAPACQSLFLEDYGSDALPHAWLGVTIGMVPCVVWVNHLSTRLPLERLFVGASLASGATLVALLSARAAQVPHATFLLFLWKEIYIVILVELFWTYANVAFATHYAQRFYGWFCASGTVGGIVGNFATGYFAKAVGTVALLWISVPTLLLTAVCALATRQAPDHQIDRTKKPPSLGDSLALLRRSSYVGWLVLLVGVVQTSITLMDFQFNEVIAASYSDLDTRTQVVSYVQAAINVGSLVLQMGTGVILRAIGLPATLLVIPLTLLTSARRLRRGPHFLADDHRQGLGQICRLFGLSRRQRNALHPPELRRENPGQSLGRHAGVPRGQRRRVAAFDGARKHAAHRLDRQLQLLADLGLVWHHLPTVGSVPRADEGRLSSHRPFARAKTCKTAKRQDSRRQVACTCVDMCPNHQTGGSRCWVG